MSHRISFESKCCETDPTVYHLYISWEDQKVQPFADILLRKHFLLSNLNTVSVRLAEFWTSGLPFGRPALIQGDDNELQTKENKL